MEPTIEARMQACQKPEGSRHSMYQKWRHLLFLHWEFEASLIQESLPSGLTVDTYDGKAFLGLVPFFMQDIRPRFCPAVPGISNFLEMNLRTYVFDKHGRPGVWFYSLDANQWLAVRVARTFFNLPYFDASMSASGETEIEYRVSRTGCAAEYDTAIAYEPLTPVTSPEPESFEYFAVERYYLFTQNKAEQLFSGKVHHSPYPLQNVEVELHTEGALALAGFDREGRSPEHMIMSPGVDVQVYPIEKV